MYQAGLVLEGGGMKGMYTCGVLEFFMDQGIQFSSCYGVSAGACHMCSYLSGQKKRAYKVGVDYLDMKEYCSAYSLLTTGELFNKSLCYDLIPNYLNPYDYEAFYKYPGKAYAVVTNIRTGKAEYMRLKEMHQDMDIIRASSSLPLVSRNVKIGKDYYLDGGIADAIPIRHSIMEGNQKNIVVLTKETGYRRKPDSHLELIKLRYLKYPKIYELMKDRYRRYNETLDYLEEQEKNGRVFMIRPQYASGIARIEKDRSKLEALYRQGYEEAEKLYDRMVAYLQN